MITIINMLSMKNSEMSNLMKLEFALIEISHIIDH